MPKANLTPRQAAIIVSALDYFISDGGINMSHYEVGEVRQLAGGLAKIPTEADKPVWCEPNAGGPHHYQIVSKEKIFCVQCGKVEEI